MARYSEEQFNAWTKPPSDTEKEKLERSMRMVKDAIYSDEKLKNISIEVFGQGSYANNTNVRLNSDIDINVRFTGEFLFSLPPNLTESDVNIAHLDRGNYRFLDYKNDVEKALVNKFGRSEVVRKDKCITIKSNSSRNDTDVVPTFNYRRYNKDGTYELGTKFISDSDKSIVNFPKQHIENATIRNTETKRIYKRLTRLHRKLRYKMIDDGERVNDNITSFLIECLIWNVPDSIMINNETWTERVRKSIIHIFNATNENSDCRTWGEVSELFYLFHENRKWKYKDVNEYMKQLWNYLEF